MPFLDGEARRVAHNVAPSDLLRVEYFNQRARHLAVVQVVIVVVVEVALVVLVA